MAEVSSIAAVALALILVWAAIAKATTPAETTADFALLGLPTPAILARLVPLAELAIGVLLVILPGWGGVAAFVMLTGFTALLVGLVRSGQQISCSCFGAVSGEPVSWVEVTRNGALLLMAAGAATLDSLVGPGFAAVVAFSAASVIAVVVIQLVTFRRDVGVIWSTQLAGEAQR